MHYNNWYEDPTLLATIVLKRYCFLEDWKNILQYVREKGYTIKKKSIVEYLRGIGITELHYQHIAGLDTKDKVHVYFNNLVGREPLKYKPPTISKKKTKNILITSDWHSPFINKELVKEIFSLSGWADILIINGDFFDYQSISRFVDYNRMSFREEFIISMELVKKIAEAFPEVLMTTGNHFSRLYKYFINNLSDKSILDTPLVTFRKEDIITKECPNIKIAQHCIETGYDENLELTFYDRLGDLMWGHFEKAYKVDTKAVTEAYKSMREWEYKAQIKMEDIKHFIQAHTHKMSRKGYDGNRVQLYESGCVCGILDYSLSANLKYSPNQSGFIMMQMKDGKVDSDTVKMCYR